MRVVDRRVVSRARRRFPAGFLFGCATAAHQVEGGTVNDWSRWEEADRGRIKDGSRSGRACDHYARYADDLKALADLGQNAHRFSIEWARVEPEEGRFDHAALAHYADVVAACRRVGMEPVVTLHHFTLPRWLADRGGVAASDAPRLFARFAALCSAGFGAEVRWWVTVNEPTVLAVMGYLEGQWPPGRRSFTGAMGALSGLVRMHAAAATVIHEAAVRRGATAMVSIAHHERRIRPRHDTLLDRAVAMPADLLFNRWFLRACSTGRLLPPAGLGEVVPGLAGSLDYIGLNHYTDDTATFDASAWATLFARVLPPADVPRSTFNWAIEPDGMRRAIVTLWNQFGLPILITENGVADRDDELRSAFLVDYLGAVHEAIDEGADVRGYLHWSSMDNFEWAEGYSQRFGLFAVDRTTMERRKKPSADVYAEICRTGALPETR